MLHDSPRFDLAAAEAIARKQFGVRGRASALTSERDQNFLIEAARGRRFVLKIANATEDERFLGAQQAVLSHLTSRVDVTPRVHPSTSGDPLVAVDCDGRSHLAWMISWLPGQPLARGSHRSTALFENFGRTVGQLSVALADFDHPAIHRDFYWDLANARGMIDRYRGLVADAAQARVFDTLVAEADRVIVPLLARLPKAAIHGDLNDYNVLINVDGDVDARGQAVTGVVDFGDMVHSYRIGDLAIAIAYAILGASDPLSVVAALVRGYCEHATPTDNELSAVFGLAVLRLCASVCIAAEQLGQRPDNAYLGVSQSEIARTLPVLATIPFSLAEAVVRQAAGVEIVPRARRVINYLKGRSSIASVFGVDPQTAPSIVLDLSVASPLVSGNLDENDDPHLTERVFGAMRAANVDLSIGRYDEPRLLYVAPAFTRGGLLDEHRTIHIGLDLFAVAGTPVFAPLDGVVHAFANNATPQDYGPVIILRHETDDGTPFCTLYGHLSGESLEGLQLGRTVTAGDRIATIGTPDVNVGWTPHLHLQIIVDLLELGTDFPGVAFPSQRAVWCALCPDPNLIARVPADRFPPLEPPASKTLVSRRSHIGGNVSIAYKQPVKIERGWMQYLYDDEGRRYLDAYNNVPHVGHCHPRVVDAAIQQMRVLNTNTRYLNYRLNEYAERLLATLPPTLEVCYFVNSASEANELALRLTRASTGRRSMIVLDAAYHGNTTGLIDLSPYKHAGPGGEGPPDWVFTAPLPDVYRGPYKASDPSAGIRYAGLIAEAVRHAQRAGGVAGFIAETCPSVGGQLIFPPRYLEFVYDLIRQLGGVCIADEVQTGLGRMGSSFWAFEDQGVVPDIVVMGKPLGNGHPIGAVATTKPIAEAFDNGMEYFSTFGGNTVSCAVGVAVLDVVRDEGLQEHARIVGERMLARLRPFVDTYEIVGDVRGSGLFLGVELVRDRTTREPAGPEAAYVANRMRERGILLGTDGPFHNVVKIRPPMPFTAEDGDRLVDELEGVLKAL